MTERRSALMIKPIRFFVPLAAAALLVGCATTDPYSGQTQRSQTGTGAAIGAAVGAAAGALSGDGSTSRRDRALIAAAVGAAAGAAVGAYRDRQEEELRQSTRGGGIEVDRRGDDLVRTVPSSVTFGLVRRELSMGAATALNDLASVLCRYAVTRVTIAGHAGSSGNADYIR